MLPEPDDDLRQFGREIAAMTAEAIRTIPPGASDVGERLVAINDRTERALRQAAEHRRQAGMCEPEVAAWLSAARAGWQAGMDAERGFLAASHDGPVRPQ